MATLTRKQYLKEFEKRAKEITLSKESAIRFFNKIGVYTHSGKLSKNYKPDSQEHQAPLRKN